VVEQLVLVADDDEYSEEESTPEMESDHEPADTNDCNTDFDNHCYYWVHSSAKKDQVVVVAVSSYPQTPAVHNSTFHSPPSEFEDGYGFFPSCTLVEELGDYEHVAHYYCSRNYSSGNPAGLA